MKIITRKNNLLPSLRNKTGKNDYHISQEVKDDCHIPQRVKNDCHVPQRVKKWLPHTPTGNITEQDELIYTGPKLVSDKIDVPQRESNRNTKPSWEIRLGQVKKLRLWTKVQRKEKQAMIVGMKRQKQNSWQVWQHNLKRWIKKYWWKKEDLKRTGSSNGNKTGHSKITNQQVSSEC